MARATHSTPTPIVTVIHEPDERAMVAALRIVLGLKADAPHSLSVAFPRVANEKKAANQ